MISDEILFLEEKSSEVRKLFFRMVKENQVYHFGGALSSVEILVYLYFYKLNAVDLHIGERDKVIFSKGHACVTLYIIFYLLGYLTWDEILSYKVIGSKLQGHPDMKRINVLDSSSGSLGQGLSFGIGIALAKKMKRVNKKVYVILGDGEIQEGQIWEAALSASKYKLDNLVCFIDKNKLQVDGFTDDVMPIEPIISKWESFGWKVKSADGHDFYKIDEAVNVQHDDKPLMIILETVKGKGISFMENKKIWHSRAITKDEIEQAKKELEEVIDE